MASMNPTGGWSAGAITPKVAVSPGAHPVWGTNTASASSPLASRGPAAAVDARAVAASQPQPSSVGMFNAIAQNNVKASDLRTTSNYLHDTSLGSRGYMSTGAGVRVAPVAKSVYGNVEVPAYLTQAVSDLNSEQALRRSLQSEWNNKIFQQASGGGEDAYLWQEAVRAASVGPGSHVNFGAAVQNPKIGQAQKTAAEAYQTQAQATANAINAPGQIAAKIQQLQVEKAAAGQNGFGQYQGSKQQAIDAQLQNLYAQQPAATTVGAAAGRGQAGWTSPIRL